MKKGRKMLRKTMRMIARIWNWLSRRDKIVVVKKDPVAKQVLQDLFINIPDARPAIIEALKANKRTAKWLLEGRETEVQVNAPITQSIDPRGELTPDSVEHKITGGQK